MKTLKLLYHQRMNLRAVIIIILSTYPGDKAYPPIVNYDAIFLNHKRLLKEENKFLYGHVTADLSKQMIVAVALATMEQLTRRRQLISFGDSVDQIVSRL